MKAIVFADGRARFEPDYPRPERGPGEALIKVAVAGICNTDLEILAGYMNFSGVPGHEFVGTVEEADTGALVGRRVVGEINCPCRACPLCEADLPNHCPNRTVLGIQNRDGAFAEYLSLPEANLHFVHQEVPDEAAVFAEPTAAAFRILEQVTVRQSERCVVLGDGKLGLIVAQVLAPRCRVSLVGHNHAKLAIAKSLGLEAFAEDGFAENAFDFAVDATGNSEGFRAALALLKPTGTLVLKTTVSGESSLPLWRIVVDEIRVVGSRCGPFEPALKAIREGAVKVDALVSARFSLEEFEAAFAKARERDSLKVLLYPGRT